MGFDVRTKNEARAFTHGRAEYGDGKIDSRTLEIEMMIFGTSQADHDTQLDAIQAAFLRQDQKFYPRADRYINISRLDKFKHEYISGFGLIRGKITATLLAVDPFIYSTTATQQNETVTSSPKAISITNPSLLDVPLKVTLAASASCVDFTIVNTTDASRQFRLADTNLVAGQTAIIDPGPGTVYRGANNIINAFTGQFLRLLPGTNALTYTGGNCTLTLEFTQIWL